MIQKMLGEVLSNIKIYWTFWIYGKMNTDLILAHPTHPPPHGWRDDPDGSPTALVITLGAQGTHTQAP